jgi:hypothetical protein
MQWVKVNLFLKMGNCPGFRKSESDVVVPGSLILLAHQKYRLPITNRSLTNSSSKSFGVYARWTTDVWQVLVRSCEACVPGARTTNFRNPAVIISTLLHSAETWATNLIEERQLDAFDNRCLCHILWVRWFHHVRNTDIHRTNQQATSLLLKVRRLRWYGHVVRIDEDRLPKRLSRTGWRQKEKRTKGLKWNG